MKLLQCLLACLASWQVLLCCADRCVAQGPATPPGWQLAWQDEFNTLDTARWELVRSFQPTNNSLHAYLPQQVSVDGGKLLIKSENIAAGSLPYRSGQVVTYAAQKYGRWEVRAKLPTTRGMWPAIWLLPDTDQYNWPSGGEIDIMENRGNQPTITSSAFHYGTNPPFAHQFVWSQQQTRSGGALVDYSADFHTYAVDWTQKYLRFYVDDVNYYTVYDSDVGGFLSQHVVPMQLVINNAIGGDFLPNPDASTQWPQTMQVDWVRVYEQASPLGATQLANGSFEANGGALTDWSVFGNELIDNPNVSVADDVAAVGDAALKVFGTFAPGTSYSGVAQGLRIGGGVPLQAKASTHVRASDSIANTNNSLVMKVEFYSEFGAKFGSPQMLGVQEIVVANGTTAVDQWLTQELLVTTPAGTAEARLAFVFIQPGNAGGAVYIDNVHFRATDRGAAIGDFNNDGLVDAADYTVWRDGLGQTESDAADANADGYIAANDLAIWRQNFGRVGPVPAALTVAVPEPAGTALLALVLAGCCAFSRRHGSSHDE